MWWALEKKLIPCKYIDVIKDKSNGRVWEQEGIVVHSQLIVGLQ